ncbi:hypothetical protein [Candidatus Palauibacter sp.]|uniref:hypothetical protein n=1 Tax=Candidatus Palauibacter sp. TaxID=3101350 RepID=UPI003C6F592B
MIRDNLRFGRVWACTAAAFCVMAVAACVESEDGPMEPATLNEAPVPVGMVPLITIAAGDHVTVDVSAFFQDPDGDPLAYGAFTTNALVAGASVAGNIMTVVAVSTGQAAGAIVARDTAGGEAVQNFAVNVPNQPPLVVRSLPALTLTAGQAQRIDLSQYFSDPEGDELEFDAATANILVAAAQASGSTLTVVAVAAGSTTLTVTARDSGGGEVQQEASVIVR